MKNTVKIYMLIFTLSFLLANCTLASASNGIPQLPAQYYGKVISPNPLSGYIEVKIEDKNYSSIPLVNNTFGGPSYLDGKLLVNAPGQDGKEVKFYLNGSILLNTSDTIYYNTGDVRYINLSFSGSTTGTSSGGGGTSSGSGGGISSGGSTSSGSEDPYPDVASDIKSEKIKEIVHKAKLIVGSEIDKDFSAKDLKTTLDLIDKSLEIKEDCILVGGPVANPIVNKYLWAFPVKISNEYPGKNKGVIQIQRINGHMVILLAGSDRWGTKAAVEYFKTLEDLPDEPIFVEWRDGKAIKINKP